MDEDLDLSIETNETGSRIELTLVSLSGKEITHAQFIMKLEQYLFEISKAEAERVASRATNH